MKINDTLCSMEWALQLREIGLEQKSFFVYEKDGTLGYLPFQQAASDSQVSAFTVPELFVFIPHFVDVPERQPFNDFRFGLRQQLIVGNDLSCAEINYVVNYYCSSCAAEDSGNFLFTPLFMPVIYDVKLADCLAKLIITLTEKGFIKHESARNDL